MERYCTSICESIDIICELEEIEYAVTIFQSNWSIDFYWNTKINYIDLNENILFNFQIIPLKYIKLKDETNKEKLTSLEQKIIERKSYILPNSLGNFFIFIFPVPAIQKSHITLINILNEYLNLFSITFLNLEKPEFYFPVDILEILPEKGSFENIEIEKHEIELKYEEKLKDAFYHTLTSYYQLKLPQQRYIYVALTRFREALWNITVGNNFVSGLGLAVSAIETLAYGFIPKSDILNSLKIEDESIYNILKKKLKFQLKKGSVSKTDISNIAKKILSSNQFLKKKFIVFCEKYFTPIHKNLPIDENNTQFKKMLKNLYDFRSKYAHNAMKYPVTISLKNAMFFDKQRIPSIYWLLLRFREIFRNFWYEMTLKRRDEVFLANFKDEYFNMPILPLSSDSYRGDYVDLNNKYIEMVNDVQKNRMKFLPDDLKYLILFDSPKFDNSKKKIIGIYAKEHEIILKKIISAFSIKFDENIEIGQILKNKGFFFNVFSKFPLFDLSEHELEDRYKIDYHYFEPFLKKNIKKTTKILVFGKKLFEFLYPILKDKGFIIINQIPIDYPTISNIDNIQDVIKKVI